jgi:NAD-dependent SIR2 family protein deacetylase
MNTKTIFKTIFFSEETNISYNADTVLINNKPVNKKEYQDITSEDFAYNKMRFSYQNILSRQYENIIVLSGAGTSVGIGIDKKGKAMSELWQEVVKEIGYSALEEFAEKIKFNELNQNFTNIENLLSQAFLASAYLKEDNLSTIISKIENIIRKECTLELPNNAPHINFLRKITARKIKYSRVKLFTLNYDLLFEHAASLCGYIVIDGFSFNSPREFDGTSYDYDIVIRNSNRAITEENFATKVFHLYKPHGSLDLETNYSKW